MMFRNAKWLILQDAHLVQTLISTVKNFRFLTLREGNLRGLGTTRTSRCILDENLFILPK
jgi:hypothetical protein